MTLATCDPPPLLIRRRTAAWRHRPSASFFMFAAKEQHASIKSRNSASFKVWRIRRARDCFCYFMEPLRLRVRADIFLFRDLRRVLYIMHHRIHLLPSAHSFFVRLESTTLPALAGPLLSLSCISFRLDVYSRHFWVHNHARRLRLHRFSVYRVLNDRHVRAYIEISADRFLC